MSQTPITITYSLEEILTRLEQKIDSNHKEVNQRFDTLQKDVNDLKVGQARLEENLAGINKRLDSQEFINRSIAAGLLLALLTGAIKLFFPNFPNLPH